LDSNKTFVGRAQLPENTWRNSTFRAKALRREVSIFEVVASLPTKVLLLLVLPTLTQTFKILSLDIAMNPGPTCTSKQLRIRCATIYIRSLKSSHKDVTTNSTIYNLQRFQDFAYGEHLDVVSVNETWLNENVSNSEILHALTAPSSGEEEMTEKRRQSRKK
jgi:hypothetical protein